MNKPFAFCFVAASLALTGCGENKIETKLKEAVKKNMRDPSSAQFRNTTIDPNYTYTLPSAEYIEWQNSDKKGPEPTNKEVAYKTELVCIEANGKNVYGAYSGYTKFCGFQYSDGTYSGFDAAKKEQFEAALRRMDSLGDELAKITASVKKRGHITPAENALANDLIYKLKQTEREVLGNIMSYQLLLANDPK